MSAWLPCLACVLVRVDSCICLHGILQGIHTEACVLGCPSLRSCTKDTIALRKATVVCQMWPLLECMGKLSRRRAHYTTLPYPTLQDAGHARQVGDRHEPPARDRAVLR